VDDSTRLRIATRIHFALLRHYGEHVEVGALLKDEAVAREVLWVCDASDDREMVALARQFRHAARGEARARAKKAASVPQAMPWAKTSGFGVSRPVGLDDDTAPARWLRPSTWLKSLSHRNPR
jgi:hypothetical protein